MNERSARALLGVSQSATTGQIKRAYRRLALETHPDRGGEPADFQRLVDAQATLLSATHTVGPRAEWIGAATVRQTKSSQPTPISSARRRATATPSAPARCFGDVLAEKLAAA